FLEDTGVGNMTHVADENGSIWQEFGVTSQPAFAFIDDDGSIQVSLGRQGQESLTAIAEELLAS
ncbi:MAG: redoxin, partial [Actinomycetota bacterium]